MMSLAGKRFLFPPTGRCTDMVHLFIPILLIPSVTILLLYRGSVDMLQRKSRMRQDLIAVNLLFLPTGKTKKSLSISMEFIVQLMYGSTVRKSVIRKGPVMMQNFVSLLTSKRVIIRLPQKFTAGVTAVSLKIRICSV